MAEKTFTTTELAEFDGRNGHPAYVAVKGVVYDVSNVPQWKGGKHHGNLAGRDLTQRYQLPLAQIPEHRSRPLQIGRAHV